MLYHKHNMNGALLDSLYALGLCFHQGIVPHWCTVLKYRSYDCYVQNSGGFEVYICEGREGGSGVAIIAAGGHGPILPQ